LRLFNIFKIYKKFIYRWFILITFPTYIINCKIIIPFLIEGVAYLLRSISAHVLFAKARIMNINVT